MKYLRMQKESVRTPAGVVSRNRSCAQSSGWGQTAKGTPGAEKQSRDARPPPFTLPGHWRGCSGECWVAETLFANLRTGMTETFCPKWQVHSATNLRVWWGDGGQAAAEVCQPPLLRQQSNTGRCQLPPPRPNPTHWVGTARKQHLAPGDRTWISGFDTTSPITFRLQGWSLETKVTWTQWRHSLSQGT